MDGGVTPVLFGSLLLLLVLGAPIAVALGVSALAAMLYLGDNPIKMVQMAWSSVGSFPLMALPSFILAGALMEAAGVSRRLINVAESLAGPFTGGISAETLRANWHFAWMIPASTRRALATARAARSPLSHAPPTVPA